MARQIIIIRALEGDEIQPGELGFRYALWAAVPAARQARYANPAATTEVADATGPELAAIQSGAVTERVETARWPAGTTVPQAEAFLVSRFTAFQSLITSRNPWQRTGTYYDGSSWTLTNNG